MMLLKLLENEKAIVFVSTADQANYLLELTSKFNIQDPNLKDNEQFFKQKFLKIHGFMNQKERSQVFLEFSTLKTGTMFCTEVAQRGLDFPDVRLIILFDVSPSYKDYINRVGRTGRLEKMGAALSLLYEEELSYAKKLEEDCKAEEIQFFRIENAFKSLYLEKEKVRNFG